MPLNINLPDRTNAPLIYADLSAKCSSNEQFVTNRQKQTKTSLWSAQQAAISQHDIIHGVSVIEELDETDYAALASFRYELRPFLHFSEPAAIATGLTPQQHQALLAIRAGENSSMLVGDLAERLMLKPHSTSELVRRLAERGLIERRLGNADRRKLQIELATHASRLLASLSAIHRAELRRLRPLLQRLLEAL